jgi:trimeric autotransporter adhesin
MSSSLLTPDLRRILDDLARRLGILERRTSQTAAPTAPTASQNAHNGSGSNSVVLEPTGGNAQASGSGSLAAGESATATNTDATAIGHNAAASGASESLAAGAYSEATGQYSSAVGPAAQATAQFAVALGDSAEATATEATALGANTVAGHSASTAVGYAAATTGTHQIMLGTASETVVMPGNVTISGTVSGFTGGGDRIPAAHTFTTTTVSGIGIVAVFDAGVDNGAAIGLMLIGDTKPRVFLRADGYILVGNGTTDPTDRGMFAGGSTDMTIYNNLGPIYMNSPDGVEISSSDIRFDGGGPVLYAPDSSAHRIVVSNAGVLSTVPA